jgi:importin subunit alpha-1
MSCAGACSADPSEQLLGVTCIRRLLSKESHPPVEPVLATGVLARLIALLASPDAKIQFEAAWAITNIASTEHTSAVVDAGAIGPLVACMVAADGNVREQAIWCAGNIAGDCSRYRDMLINTPGAVDALIANLQQPESPSLLRNATWTLSNLCRGKPSPSEVAVRYVLPALAALAHHADADVVADAAWGLSYLTDCDDAIVAAVIETGVVPRCVALMASEEVTVVMPALRTVGNLISAKDDRFTQAALEAGALRPLVPLLAHPKRNVRREACWAVSNVAAGTGGQIELLMTTPGLMVNVIGQLRNGEWNVKKEATWVISNVAASGNAAHVRTLVGLGVVDPLADLLKSADVRVLCLVLDTIAAVLEVGAKMGARGSAFSIADLFEQAGLLDTLEELQKLDSDDVYDKAVAIIEKYYGEEDGGGDQEAVPAVAGGGMALGGFPGFGAAGGLGAFGAAGAPALAFGGGFHAAAGNVVGGIGAAPWAASFMTPPSGHGAALAAPGAAVPACLPAAAPSAPAFNFGGISFA